MTKFASAAGALAYSCDKDPIKMRCQSSAGSWILAATLALTACGCGSAPPVAAPQAVLQGKVTKGGQPLAVDPQMTGYAFVQVIFIPAGTRDPLFNERVDPTGSFTVTTDDGKPPPAGKYRVAVRQWEPYPSTDKLGGKFDEMRTPIVVEITNPPKDLTIDLDKPQG